MINLDVIRPRSARNFTVFRDERCFAAWPFNCGVWKFPGDEVVVGYARRSCEYRERFETWHQYDPADGSNEHCLARSSDGGATWKAAPFAELRNATWRARASLFPAPTAVDFRDPNLALHHTSDMALISTDRGRTWPYAVRLPHAGFDEVMGRPDYVIRPDGACVLFSTVSTTSGVEGRPVAYISRNGGLSWELFSLMTEEPRFHMVIMPSGLWLPSGRMIAAVRVQMQKHGFSFWSQVLASDDGGRTWGALSRVNDIGAPCHLLLLDDGRVLATYGYRTAPFGIRARVSEDEGRSWGPEIILRDDGKSWDLGYPKTVQLDGGDLLSVYYFNDQTDPVNADGGVRYIAGTRWAV